MPGGYVSGRKFNTDNEYKAAIEDSEVIAKLKKNTNFEDPLSVERLYGSLQSGEIKFKTIIGRDFDDELFELVERNKRKQAYEQSNSTSKTKKLARNRNNGKQKYKKQKNADSKNKQTKNTTGKNSTAGQIYADIDAVAYQIIKKRDVRRKVIIAVASVLAIGSLSYFGIYTKQAHDAQAAYDELAKLKGSEPIVEEIEQKPLFTLADEYEMPDILDEYKNIYLKNKSIVGWLSIKGTNIDYPVMQTVNNEYYLTHDFDGNEDRNGALFVDCQCNIPFRSDNIIIYGHRMKSGKMFGTLKKYESEEFCETHSTIIFDTIYEKGTYEVMYVFKDNIRDEGDVSFKYYQFIDASTEEEYNSNLKTMSDMSLVDTGVSAEYGDDLLTLSTCSGSTSTERFVVVAKRIK